MKTPVIFVLVHIITFGWCHQPSLLLSMIESPYLFRNIKEADIRDQIDKLNPECSNFTEKLTEETFPTVGDCIRLAAKDFNSTVCEMAHNIFENCTAPAETVFENCITNDHKYWPSLFKKSLISLQQYVCETRGGSLIELLNPCIWTNPKNTSINERFQKYEEKLQAKFEEYRKTLPFPKEFCHFQKNFAIGSAPRKYISTRVGTTCHDPETKNAILNLYDAITAPCGQFNAVEGYKNITYSHDIEF